MGRIIKQLVLFLLPVLLFVALPIWRLTHYKESFFRTDRILAEISTQECLVGYAYNQNFYEHFKLKSILACPSRFDVISLGSSRVLQFRRQMFIGNFYNAGFVLDKVNEFESFMSLLPEERKPKVLIIGLDQWMFNHKTHDLNRKLDTKKWTKDRSKDYNGYLLSNINSFYEDFIDNPSKLFQSVSQDEIQRIGMNANINNNGFRNDGSLCYGSKVELLLEKNELNPTDKFKKTLHNIEIGDARFQHDDKYNLEAIEILDSFLAKMKKENIQVIGFLPPFPPHVLNVMKDSGKYHYFDKLPDAIREVIQSYNFEFYDFTDMTQFNSGDHEAIDGFHGGEVSYCRLLIKMLESNSKLNDYCNINQLKMDLVSRPNDYYIYNSLRTK